VRAEHQQAVAVEGQGITEAAVGNGIGGCQFVHLGPGRLRDCVVAVDLDHAGVLAGIEAIGTKVDIHYPTTADVLINFSLPAAIDNVIDYCVRKTCALVSGTTGLTAEQLKKMDDLPLLAWHLIEPKVYLKYETLFITSRGCPHRCAFCYNEQYNCGQWRAMSATRVKAEIDHAQKSHPIRRFRFDDDNFCVDKSRVYSILDFLPEDIPLYFECRVDYIDEEFCQRLSVFKDPFLFLGIESGNDDMLKKMQKDFTTQQIRDAYKLLNKYRIKTSASFIIGAPGETARQINDTLRLVNEINPTRPSCCIYTPFPGSKFACELIQKGKMSESMSLYDWGNYADGEKANGFQLSEVDNATLNKIYSLFWRKFVLSFILNFRFKWIAIGLENYAKMKALRFLRFIHRDIY